MDVRKVGGGTPEASAPRANCFAGLAGGNGIGEAGPCHRAVRMDLRLGQVARVVWLRIFITGVDVSALHGVIRTDDDVCNSLWVGRWEAKADGVPVENLVQDG